MALFTEPVGRRRLIALIGGAVCLLLAKGYLFVHDREQYEDGNLLITVVFTMLAAGVIYLLLWLGAKVRRHHD